MWMKGACVVAALGIVCALAVEPCGGERGGRTSRRPKAGAGSSGSSTQPTELDKRASKLVMFDENTGALLRGDTVYKIDIQDGKLTRAGTADDLAFNRKRRLLLTCSVYERESKMTVYRWNGKHLRALFTDAYSLRIAETVECNVGSAAFCVVWHSPVPDGQSPIWGVHLIEVADEYLDLNPVPRLSGMCSLVRPGSLVFGHKSKLMCAGACFVTEAAMLVMPSLKSEDSDENEMFGYPSGLLLISGARDIWSYPVPGLSSARAIAFSGDDSRLLARLNLPPEPLTEEEEAEIEAFFEGEWMSEGESKDTTSESVPKEKPDTRPSDARFWFIDTKTGKSSPCPFLPQEGRVLAVSTQLSSAILRSEERVMYFDDKGAKKEVCRIPSSRLVVAAYTGKVFTVTDGESLWRVYPGGRTVRKGTLTEAAAGPQSKPSDN